MFMLTGCTIYRPAPHPIYSSSEPIAGRSFQVTGAVRGESCQWWVLLGFPVSDGGRVHDAYGAAVAGGADALIDLTVDTKLTAYPFAQKNCVIVEGQAIRFKKGR
ncbi:MAG: hypothetical protein ACE5FL_05525 [Myxococcota bacterium]